jgi:hypothetical protein
MDESNDEIAAVILRLPSAQRFVQPMSLRHVGKRVANTKIAQEFADL